MQAQEEDTEDSLAVKRAGFEKVNGFAVDDSVIGTMYAKQSVNVRKGPSTDYEKIGNLSFAQEINVTGAADNGWYHFRFRRPEGLSFLTSTWHGEAGSQGGCFYRNIRRRKQYSGKQWWRWWIYRNRPIHICSD